MINIVLIMKCEIKVKYKLGWLGFNGAFNKIKVISIIKNINKLQKCAVVSTCRSTPDECKFLRVRVRI